MNRRTTTHIIIHREEAPAARHEYNAIIDLTGAYVVGIAGEDGVAAHALRYNATAFGLALQGDFCRGAKALHNVPNILQMRSLMPTLQRLMKLYHLGPEAVRGHSEMGKLATAFPEKLCFNPDGSCPGLNFDMEKLRTTLADFINDAELQQFSSGYPKVTTGKPA